MKTDRDVFLLILYWWFNAKGDVNCLQLLAFNKNSTVITPVLRLYICVTLDMEGLSCLYVKYVLTCSAQFIYLFNLL